MWPGPSLNSTTGSLSLTAPSQLAKLPDPTSPGVLEGLEPNSSASCQSLTLLLPGPPGLICCSAEQPSEQPLPFPGRKLGPGRCLFPQHFLPLLIWTYLAGHLVLKGPGQAVARLQGPALGSPKRHSWERGMARGQLVLHGLSPGRTFQTDT